MKASKNTPKKKKDWQLVMQDTGLTESEARFALELQKKRPELVASYRAVKEAEGELKGKWIGLCEHLRKPQEDGTMMNAREMSLLLRGLGEPRSRVSEIVRVVTVADPVWLEYKAGIIGFKAALAKAREADTPPAAEATTTEAKPDTDSGADDEPQVETPALPHLPLPGALLKWFGDVLDQEGAQLMPGKVPYVMRYTKGKRSILLTLEVDESA